MYQSLAQVVESKKKIPHNVFEEKRPTLLLSISRNMIIKKFVYNFDFTQERGGIIISNAYGWRSEKCPKVQELENQLMSVAHLSNFLSFA